MKLHSAVLLATLLLLVGGSAMAQSTGGDVYTGCLKMLYRLPIGTGEKSYLKVLS